MEAQTPSTPSLRLLKAQYLKRRGNEAFASQNYREAWGRYSEALEILPPGPTAVPEARALLSNRCRAYLGAGRAEAALADAQALAASHPGWAKSHFRLGAALLALNRAPEAIKALQQAWSLAKGDAACSRQMELAVAKLTHHELADGLLQLAAATLQQQQQHHKGPVVVKCDSSGAQGCTHTETAEGPGNLSAASSSSAGEASPALRISQADGGHATATATTTVTATAAAPLWLQEAMHAEVRDAAGRPSATVARPAAQPSRAQYLAWLLAGGMPPHHAHALLSAACVRARRYGRAQAHAVCATAGLEVEMKCSDSMALPPKLVSESQVDELAELHLLAARAYLAGAEAAVGQQQQPEHYSAASVVSQARHALVAFTKACRLCPGWRQEVEGWLRRAAHLLGDDEEGWAAAMEVTMEGWEDREPAAASAEDGQCSAASDPATHSTAEMLTDHQATPRAGGESCQQNGGVGLPCKTTTTSSSSSSKDTPQPEEPVAVATASGCAADKLGAATSVPATGMVSMALTDPASPSTQGPLATAAASAVESCPAACPQRPATALVCLAFSGTQSRALTGPVRAALRRAVADMVAAACCHQSSAAAGHGLTRVDPAGPGPGSSQVQAWPLPAVVRVVLGRVVAPRASQPDLLVHLEVTCPCAAGCSALGPDGLAQLPNRSPLLGQALGPINLQACSVSVQEQGQPEARGAGGIQEEPPPLPAPPLPPTALDEEDGEAPSEPPRLIPETVGYRLVTHDGRPIQRAAPRHPFGLSRCHYAAADLPGAGQATWCEPFEGGGDEGSAASRPGRQPRCRWRQSASEVKVIVLGVPRDLPAKQLRVALEPSQISVSNRLTGQVYLSGRLQRPILPQDSTWVMGRGAGEDGCLLSLAKMNRELMAGDHVPPSATWWPRLLTHHADMAWDDDEKDYSDLPEQVLEEHWRQQRLEERAG